MFSHPEKKELPPAAQPATAAVNIESLHDVYELLRQAAEAAARAGLPPEAFATAAWQAYMTASPELAERLADMQLDAALEELRKSGRMAKA